MPLQTQQFTEAQALKYWQLRTVTTIWITYFAYYLCRLNMPVAGTSLREEFTWSKSEFGCRQLSHAENCGALATGLRLELVEKQRRLTPSTVGF
jgi:hypothetical protein